MDMNMMDEKKQQEGRVARAIERQTSKLPSDLFLWSAVGSIVASLSFMVGGKAKVANFIGQWAPTFLLLGLYSKLVQQEGGGRAASNPGPTLFDRQA